MKRNERLLMKKIEKESKREKERREEKRRGDK